MNYEQAQKMSKLKKENELLFEQVKGLTDAVELLKVKTCDESEKDKIIKELKQRIELLKKEAGEKDSYVEKLKAELVESEKERATWEKRYDKVKRGKTKEPTDGVKHGPKSRRQT